MNESARRGRQRFWLFPDGLRQECVSEMLADAPCGFPLLQGNLYSPPV